MKKLAVFSLAFVLAFTFCKKNSTDTEENREDKITVEIKVTENGEAISAIFVEIDATVGECIGDEEAAEWNTERLPTQETQEDVTNQYGLATFNYENKSLSDNTIIITEIRILKSGNLVHIDTEDKTIQRNSTERFEYEIGG